MAAFPSLEAIYYALRGGCRYATRSLENPLHVRLDIRTARSLPDLVEGVLRTILAAEPAAEKRLLATDDRAWQESKHRERRYFAETQELLYIGNPGLTEKYARCVNGLWMVTNIGRPEASTMIQEIRRASSIPIEPWSRMKI